MYNSDSVDKNQNIYLLWVKKFKAIFFTIILLFNAANFLMMKDIQCQAAKLDFSTP